MGMSDCAQTPLGISGIMRRLPHNTDAEMAVLGSILVDNSVFARVSGLHPEHFVLGEHAQVFEACGRLIGQGRVADPITLKDLFEHDETLTQIGGVEYLIKLADAAVSYTVAADYSRIITECWQRREMIAIGEDVVNKAYAADIGEDPRDIAGLLAADVEKVTRSGKRGLKVRSASRITPDIPPRGWLLGALLCRRNVTALVAPGGTGKTSVAIAWAWSLATGSAIVEDRPTRKARVLLVTAEDGEDEVDRRILACRLRYSLLEPADDAFVAASIVGGGETLLRPTPSGEFVEGPLARMLEETIREHRSDVLILDPWVKISGAPENDNIEVDKALRILVRIACSMDVAVLILHHVKKGGASPGNVDAARGATALMDGARIGLTLNRMSTDEASAMGVSEDERMQLVRLDDGKANMTPLSAAVAWYRLCSINLGNATAEYPKGDNVQAVERWTPPDTWEGLSTAICNRILDDIDAGLPNGDRYSDASAAGDRAAWAVVQTHCPDKTEHQCRQIITAWRKAGLLKVEEYFSPEQRKKRSGLAVNDEKRPS